MQTNMKPKAVYNVYGFVFWCKKHAHLIEYFALIRSVLKQFEHIFVS